MEPAGDGEVALNLVLGVLLVNLQGEGDDRLEIGRLLEIDHPAADAFDRADDLEFDGDLPVPGVGGGGGEGLFGDDDFVGARRFLDGLEDGGIGLALRGGKARLHGIERLAKDGITFYTVAMGGGSHHGWGVINADTKFREENQAVSGFLKIHDGGSELVLEYFDTNLNLLDRVKIVRVEA